MMYPSHAVCHKLILLEDDLVNKICSGNNMSSVLLQLMLNPELCQRLDKLFITTLMVKTFSEGLIQD